MTTHLDFGSQYPKRPPFYANDFIRKVEREGVADLLGPVACWLLTVIVLTEDSKRYRRAPWFRMRYFEVRIGRAHDAIREIARNCVREGWLHWEQTHNRAPIYAWVLEPHWLQLHDENGMSGKSAHSPVVHPSFTRDSPADHTASTIPSPIPISPPPSQDWAEAAAAIRSEKVVMDRRALAECQKNALSPSDVLDLITFFRSHKDRYRSPSGALDFALRHALPEHRGEWWQCLPDATEFAERLAVDARTKREAAQQTKLKSDEEAKLSSIKADSQLLIQWEGDYGQILDELPEEEVLELCPTPTIREICRKRGRGFDLIRPDLLKAMAEFFSDTKGGSRG